MNEGNRQEAIGNRAPLRRDTFDVIVVGGGVIGCATAYELARDGVRVTLLERDRIAAGASGAAAGMLAPQSEANADDDWFRFLLAGRAEHPSLAQRLLAETGEDVEYRPSGVLKVALGEQERGELESRGLWQHAAGLAAEWLEPSEAVHLEPACSPKITGALWLPDESQIMGPKLTRALAIGAGRLGAEVHDGTPVIEVLSDRGVVTGVRTAFETVQAPAVVLCSGVWTPLIAAAVPELPVRPVKGQMLSALAPAGKGPRHVLWGEGAYLVPKSGGRVFVGATEEDSFDARPTLAGVSRLASAGARLLPALADMPLDAAWAGLRPVTPDRRPVLGRVPDVDGLFLATGHYRNGILLGPLTGKIMAGLIAGKASPIDLRPFAPERLLGATAAV